RALITRYLEQSVYDDTFGRIDVSGQTGGNNITNSFGSFSNNYSPTPRIRGNLFTTYQKNAFAITAQIQYVGSGKLNVQNGWLAPGDTATFVRQSGGEPYSPSAPPPICEGIGLPADCENPITVSYHPNRDRTVTSNELPSWTTLNLNISYDFGRSRRVSLDRFESLNVFLNIDNVGDRIPTFFSGTGAGGLNTALF